MRLQALGRDLAEGFEMLDADNGAGWELLRNMLARNPRDRWSAKQALSSAFLTGKSARTPLFAGEMGSKAGSDSTVTWLLDGLAKSGTTKVRESSQLTKGGRRAPTPPPRLVARRLASSAAAPFGGGNA